MAWGREEGLPRSPPAIASLRLEGADWPAVVEWHTTVTDDSPEESVSLKALVDGPPTRRSRGASASKWTSSTSPRFCSTSTRLLASGGTLTVQAWSGPRPNRGARGSCPSQEPSRPTGAGCSSFSLRTAPFCFSSSAPKIIPSVTSGDPSRFAAGRGDFSALRARPRQTPAPLTSESRARSTRRWPSGHASTRPAWGRPCPPASSTGAGR